MKLDILEGRGLRYKRAFKSRKRADREFLKALTESGQVVIGWLDIQYKPSSVFGDTFSKCFVFCFGHIHSS